MRAKTRRNISLLFIFSFLAIFFGLLAVSFWQTRTAYYRNRMPLTLRERLLNVFPVEDLALDLSSTRNIIVMRKDVIIKFGDTKQVATKVKILGYLEPIIQARAEKIEYVDVRFPNNIVIKYHE